VAGRQTSVGTRDARKPYTRFGQFSSPCATGEVSQLGRLVSAHGHIIKWHEGYFDAKRSRGQNAADGAAGPAGPNPAIGTEALQEPDCLRFRFRVSTARRRRGRLWTCVAGRTDRRGRKGKKKGRTKRAFFGNTDAARQLAIRGVAGPSGPIYASEKADSQNPGTVCWRGQPLMPRPAASFVMIIGEVGGVQWIGSPIVYTSLLLVLMSYLLTFRGRNIRIARCDFDHRPALIRCTLEIVLDVGENQRRTRL